MATTNSPVINPTPKARFLADQNNTNRHRNIMQDPVLQHSLDTALAEFQIQLASQTPDGNFNACAAAHIKMQGAIQFIHTLKFLGERTIVPIPVNRDNLEQA